MILFFDQILVFSTFNIMNCEVTMKFIKEEDPPPGETRGQSSNNLAELADAEEGEQLIPGN